MVTNKNYSSTTNILDLNSKISDKLYSIIGPLLDNFPISTFAYWRLFSSGHYFSVTNNAEILKLYYEHITSSQDKVFLENFKFIDLNTSYKFLWPVSIQSETIGLNALRSYNVCYGMSVNFRHLDGFEDFIFASPRENPKVTDLFMNDYYIIERFILHFRNKIKDIIDFNNTKIFPNSHFYHEMILEQKKIDIERRNQKILVLDRNLDRFYNDTKLKRINLKSSPEFFTEKEIECLYYIMLGCSAKEVANALYISYRTIEKHIENIKRKCNTTYISELKKIGKAYDIDKLHITLFDKKFII